MAKKVVVKETEKVKCSQCKKAGVIENNACFCYGLQHRVCACERYGKSITECNGNYEKKI